MSDQEKLKVRFKTYRLSWTAYVRPIFLLSLFSFIAFMLATIEPETLRSSTSGRDWTIIHPYLSGLGWVMFGFFVLRLVYVVLSAKAIRFYTDEDGVWIYAGILPWNKGRYGVRWQDMDRAGFRISLISWLFNSYRITVSHKYTKASEISLSHVSDGKEAIKHINDTHRSIIRDGGAFHTSEL